MSLEREAFEEIAKEAAIPELDDIPEIEAGPSTRISDLIPDLSFLLAETGPGAIEDYVEHPLNFRGSKGVAQILRGATGIAGNLNYAIIDIGLGLVQLTKEGKDHGGNITNPE